MATNSTKTEDAIRDTVYKRAIDYVVLSLDEEKIKVQHVGQMGTAQSPSKPPTLSR